MERGDLFFKTKAKDFDIDKIELHPVIKSEWRQKSKQAAESCNYWEEIQLLLDTLGFREGIEILDVGCGVGLRIIELAHLGAKCTGLDVREDTIRLINRVRDDFGLTLRGVHGDALDLPFDSETFDVVISWQFFEHVIDIDMAIKEQIRVLRNGGRLIIEQANLLNPFTLFDLLVKYPRRTQGSHGGLKWLFTKSGVRENIYGTGWTGKDEDIHTRLWWRMQMRHYPNVRVDDFTSSMVRRRGGLFRLLEPVLGNVLIVATKEPKPLCPG